MPLLSILQLNAQGSGSGGGGGGGGTGGRPVPGTPNPAPQRGTIQYTQGAGFFVPKLPTVSTAPLLGPEGNVPLHPYIFGVDFDEYDTASVGAMSAGTSKTIVQAVTLPDIPAIQLDVTDSGAVTVIPRVYLDPIVAGLIIASVECQAQALQQSSGTWVLANQLTPGDAYTATRALFTISLYAAQATAATNLHLGAGTQVIIFSA